ncbi:MAG: hypothetical protein ACKOXM_03805, partial [Agromyces sp.]
MIDSTLLLGAGAVALALLVLVLMTIFPPAPRINAARRVAEGQDPRTGLSFVSDQIDDTAKKALRSGPLRGLSRIDLELSDIR